MIVALPPLEMKKSSTFQRHCKKQRSRDPEKKKQTDLCHTAHVTFFVMFIDSISVRSFTSVPDAHHTRAN